MPKVILQGYIMVPDTDLETVYEELETHTQLTNAEEGCLVFEILQDQSNPNRFDVYEEFADEQSFLQHQERARESKWGAATLNVQRHYQITGLESE